MTANLEQIIAQLSEAIGKIDEAAVLALRMKTDADEAHGAYSHVAVGTSDKSSINQAARSAQRAATKANDLAENLAGASNAFADYLNIIAPGSAPARSSSSSAMPSGERLVTGAEQQQALFNRVLSKQVKKADDTQDRLEDAEGHGRDVVNLLRHKPRGSGTPSTTQPSQPTQSQEQLAVDNPITAAIMATGAMVVAGKATLNHFRKRKERKSDGADDDQT